MYALLYLACVLWGILFFPLIARMLARRQSSAFLTALVVSVGSVYFSVLAAELWFRLWYVRSDSLAFTLSSKAWTERYWKPLNRFGYRDAEVPDRLPPDSCTLLVAGDSFTAGHGIEHPETRFANVLASKLPPYWRTFIVADNHWSTADQIEGIFSFPFAPDVVLLSYFVNDIEHVRREEFDNLLRDMIGEAPPRWRPLIEHSHLANFVYWRLIKRPGQDDDRYWKMIRDSYRDKKSWSRHKSLLSDFANRLASQDAQLVVMLWPSLTAIEDSQEFLDKVAAVFEEQQVPVINLSDQLAAIPLEKRLVNALDAHPHQRIHGLVGLYLYQTIFKTLHLRTEIDPLLNRCRLETTHNKMGIRHSQ